MTLFSERYGYKKIKMLKKDEMPLSTKNKILNLIYEYLYKEILDDFFIDNHFADSPALRFAKYVWTDFFNGSLFEVDNIKSRRIIDKVCKASSKLKWFEIYDYIEFILKNHSDRKKMRHLKKDILNLLKMERMQYTIINNRICPSKRENEEEIKEIEKALNIPDKFEPVRKHLSKALVKWSDRKNPDYENSIKESISAVDVLVQIVLGKEGKFGKLIKELKVHPALAEGFRKLYGWTSDDPGIRHTKNKEPLSCGEPEARYMLITCSAFVNYVIEKLSFERRVEE
ncbi:MAG TPA: hypothetical protein ENI34_08225 [candidate division WOR-3 bacterium]|uniref:HEPN AbiJ-N-terminal domain-containing protein n=1 Tax=candidate division WOR-3 bacterium TaxID=2052148 RepID=A0A9C9ENA8_UNCW3|nr:hypothetical protein [candidate division WOR-3 bacterium]